MPVGNGIKFCYCLSIVDLEPFGAKCSLLCCESSIVKENGDPSLFTSYTQTRKDQFLLDYCHYIKEG